MSIPVDFPAWFRNAAPYINQHRGRTCVIRLEGGLLESGNFQGIIHDIALLHALGIRLVLCFGACPQVQAALNAAGCDPDALRSGPRVTCDDSLQVIKREVGRMRADIEAALSMGLVNTPMHHSAIQVVGGNLITARPAGIIEGIDLKHTGLVRKVDVNAIQRHLDQGFLVLIPPLGYSVTGEAFNLSSEDVAHATAVSLGAHKLILFNQADALVDTANQPIRQTCPDQVLAGLVKAASETDQAMLMRGARSCEAGVRRIHIINGQTNGALIQELFTLDGIGTMITTEGYQQIRDAGIEDVAGILELIRPLEEKGTLVRRSREMLENEIDRFMVVERDNRIIACAALYPWPAAACAELACVVVDDAYRGRKLGDALLGHALDRAHSAHMERLFVLTTQSAHWFLERGFEQGHVNDLPIERQAMYNLQRQSAVYIRNISHAARQPESSTSQSTHH